MPLCPHSTFEVFDSADKEEYCFAECKSCGEQGPYRKTAKFAGISLQKIAGPHRPPNPNPRRPGRKTLILDPVYKTFFLAEKHIKTLDKVRKVIADNTDSDAHVSASAAIRLVLENLDVDSIVQACA